MKNYSKLNLLLFLVIIVFCFQSYSSQKIDVCKTQWSLKVQNIIDLIKIKENDLTDLYDYITAIGLGVFNSANEKNPIIFGVDRSTRESWNSMISCNHKKIETAIRAKQLPSLFQTYIYDLAEINESLQRILDELYEQNKKTKGQIKDATLFSIEKRLIKYQEKIAAIKQNPEFNFELDVSSDSKSLEEIFKNYQEFFKKYADIKAQYKGKLSADQINYFFQALGIFNVNITGKTQSEIEKSKIGLVRSFVDKLDLFQKQLLKEISQQVKILNKISSFNYFEKKREREKLKVLEEMNKNSGELRDVLQSKYAITKQTFLTTIYLELMRAEAKVFDRVIGSLLKAIER